MRQANVGSGLCWAVSTRSYKGNYEEEARYWRRDKFKEAGQQSQDYGCGIKI